MSAGEQSNGVGTRSTRYESLSDSIAEARDAVLTWLESLAVDESIRERAVLAISELVTNSVQASVEPFDLTMVQLTGSGVRFDVTNDAEPSAIPPRSQWRPDEVLSPRGRGLMIAESVSDRMEIIEHPGRVTARVEFDVSN